MKAQHYAQVNELDNITVSYSNKAANPELRQTSLKSILTQIKRDTELERIVDAIRSEPDKDKKTKLKEENLPYFVLGTFKNNYRNSNNLISTQFISIDFDSLNGNADELDEKLRSDKNVYSFFKSPSNNRKVIYKLDRVITDATDYRNTYIQMLPMFTERYGFETDPKTKDAAREIFLSYDPDLYVNPNPEPLDTSWITPPVKRENKINLNKIGSEEVKFVPSAIEYLKEKLEGYEDWMNCGFALASLGEAGREYFIELSDNPKYNDSIDDINNKFDNFVETRTGDITLATLFKIAKNYGYEYPELPKQTESPIDRLDYASELRERFDLDDNRDPNKPLGFPLTKFKELGEHTDGIQPGFYHLAAESNIGKTAVFTNLALDLLETNSGVSVMYFSLDDSRRYTAYRFLSILSQLHINKIQKPQLDPLNFDKIVYARNKFLDLVDTDRLIVKDLGDITHIDQLKTVITSFTDLSKLVVFVDGLYNLEVTADGNQGIRIENIERAQKVKQIVDTYKIPFLSTGELRKKMKNEGKKTKPTLHDLMETGKYAYNANVVWLLSSHTVDPLTKVDTLSLEFAKNKLSDFKGEQYLVFDRPTGTIRESNIVPISVMLNDYDEDIELGGENE
jgi:hypothetical protein